MIWWVYEQCRKVEEFSGVIVATDDERIFRACRELGMCVEMTSDTHLTGRADHIGLYLTRAAAPHPKGTSSYSFYKQLGIYAFTKEALAFFSEYGKAHGKAKNEKIEDVEMLRFIENGWPVQFIEAEASSVAVDTLSDLEKVTSIIKKRSCET